MFEHLKDYTRILVTGPHRSGTRICTQMIAFDTGHRTIDEIDLEMDSLYRLANFFESRGPFVAQCPALCQDIHLFGRVAHTAIVMMRRDVAAIEASQERIGWKHAWIERAKYGLLPDDPTPIALAKYAYWEATQRAQIDHAFEVEYASLADHPLWVAPDQRRGFWPTQTATRAAMRFHPAPDVAITSQGEALALVKTRGSAKTLNGSGRLIWSLLAEGATFGEIVDAMRNAFEGADDLEQDVIDFLDVMVRQGLVIVRNPSREHQARGE